MKSGLLITLGLAVIAALPAGAETYRAVNGLYVVTISRDSFEVIEDRGAGAADIWCAAADYTRAAGRDRARQRMFIDVPRGPSQTTANRIGVTFTLAPDAAIRNTPQSYSVSVKRRGENLAVGHAYNFCRNLIDELFDRF